jgi:hypothetical protein
MRYLTEVICSNCRHREDTTEYNKECPVCADDFLREVVLECECGKAYNDNDLDLAQENYSSLKHQESLSTEQLWEIVWEDYANYHKEEWYKPMSLKWEDDGKGFRYIGSSHRTWCYGTEAYTWEDYYQCECGKTLEYDNGW